MKDKNKMSIKAHSKMKVVGLSSFLALTGLLGVALICPTSYDGAYAADSISDAKTFNIDFALSKYDSKTFNIDFLLSSQLSVSIDDMPGPASATVTPTKDGSATTATTTFSVSTNSNAGYGVYVYSANSNLVGSNASNVIPSISSAVTGVNSLPKGTWGFGLSKNILDSAAVQSLEYKPMNTSMNSSSPDGGSSTTASKDQYTLAFGTKVGYETTPDTYTNQVNVQVVANAASTNLISEGYELRNEILDYQAKQNAEKESTETSETTDEHTSGEVASEETPTENAE